VAVSDGLRILQVCSASKLVYGAAHSLMTLASAQRGAGNHVEFVTFKGKRFGSQVRQLGFPVHEVRVLAKIDLLALLKIRKIIRRGRFDLVHTHLSTSSVNGCLASRLAGVPSFATVHGMSGKLSFIGAGHLIAVSEEVRSHLVRQGVAPRKISVVYNGLSLNTPCLSRTQARSLVDLPQYAPVVGTVARVTALKGIEDVIRAMPQMLAARPDLLYVVVGDGDAMLHCQTLAQQLGVERSVRFVGYQSHVEPYLVAMDVFLFPSLKEAMGLALVEAMAARVPCVATRVGGIPEVLGDCGVLVPPSHPAALAGATLEMLSNSELRRTCIEGGLQRAHQIFSDEAMERSTDWVYREQLGLPMRVVGESAHSVQSPR
jgi:glycosyltransferase involved in cell wall biosynthesis